MKYHRQKNGGLGTSGTLEQVSMLDKSAVLGSPLMMGLPAHRSHFVFSSFIPTVIKMLCCAPAAKLQVVHAFRMW